jgi:hypothetical protein
LSDHFADVELYDHSGRAVKNEVRKQRGALSRPNVLEDRR